MMSNKMAKQNFSHFLFPLLKLLPWSLLFQYLILSTMVLPISQVKAKQIQKPESQARLFPLYLISNPPASPVGSCSKHILNSSTFPHHLCYHTPNTIISHLNYCKSPNCSPWMSVYNSFSSKYPERSFLNGNQQGSLPVSASQVPSAQVSISGS